MTQDVQDREIIVVPGENGNEEEFEVLVTFTLEETDKSYMLIAPLDANDEDEDDVFAFRYEEDGEELLLYLIEDEEEWERVEEAFNAILAPEDEEEEKA